MIHPVGLCAHSHGKPMRFMTTPGFSIRARCEPKKTASFTGVTPRIALKIVISSWFGAPWLWPIRCSLSWLLSAPTQVLNDFVLFRYLAATNWEPQVPWQPTQILHHRSHIFFTRPKICSATRSFSSSLWAATLLPKTYHGL